MIKLIDIDKYFKPNLKQARKRTKADIEHKDYQLDERLQKLGLGKFYKIQTYGCQGNEADGETMAGILNQMGYQPTEDESQADIILINTCAIRENAENRIWGELGRLKKLKYRNPNLLIGLCGCMAQEENDAICVLERYEHVEND